MAVIRYQDGDNTVSYIATVTFFLCVSCVTLMLKFGRFKTSFNVYSGSKKKAGKRHDDFSSTMSVNGAYRTNRDEFFVYSNYSESNKVTSPATVPPAVPAMPTQTSNLRQTKSTSDLIKEQNLPPNLRGAQSGISLDPRGAETENSNNRTQAVDPKKNKKQLDAHKRVEKQRLEEQKKLEKQRAAEQKKLEKQRLDEQKKSEKLAQQERAKQDKLKKEREKKEAQLAKKNKKGKAPQRPLANPLAQSSTQASNPLSQPSGTQYSTNTLDSSISKTSGPPPYTENPAQESNSNVSFSKPEDTGSWDMISQHRHNLGNRPTNKGPAPKGKVTTLDLNYTLGEDNRANSEV